MPELKPWRQTGSRLLADAKIFSLYSETAISPRTDQEREFTRIQSPDWVNVVPLTRDRDIVLVRQWRHGTQGFTLEIPGGLIDLGERPAAAAAREVREETGFAGDPPVEIGVVEPNPAFLSNVTYTFLIENCSRVGDLQLDAGEDIEVVLEPLSRVPQLVATGAIRHSLVINGFWWLALRRPDLLRLPG